MNELIEEKYVAHYVEAVSAFVREVDGTDPGIMPEVHLPLWGETYEACSPRIVFVGQDTRGWGDMKYFLQQAKMDVRKAVPLRERQNEFRNKPFFESKSSDGWGRQSIFWKMVRRFLVVFYGSNWANQSFVWANVNSIERWGQGGAVDQISWGRLKKAAERHIDSLSAILDIFSPDIVVVMSRKAPASFWQSTPQFTDIGPRVGYGYDRQHQTHIFHTDHPNFLRWRKGQINNVVEVIYSQWKGMRNFS